VSPSLATHRKAQDYLLRELVNVACEDGVLVFRIRGRSGNWTVRDENGGPHCNCPSWRRRCAHVLVAEMLTNGRPKR
jgi:hypothetical protein